MLGIFRRTPNNVMLHHIKDCFDRGISRIPFPSLYILHLPLPLPSLPLPSPQAFTVEAVMKVLGSVLADLCQKVGHFRGHASVSVWGMPQYQYQSETYMYIM